MDPQTPFMTKAADKRWRTAVVLPFPLTTRKQNSYWSARGRADRLVCQSCTHPNPHDAVFCGGCGHPLQLSTTCATCQRTTLPGLKFCHGCGTRLTASSQPYTPQGQGVEHLTVQPHEARSQAQNTSMGTSSAGCPPANRFRYDGDYWTLVFQGTECRLKAGRGLEYLAYLLAHPYQELPAVDIARGGVAPQEEGTERRAADMLATGARVADLGDAGEIIDPQARADYKRRLHELHEELTEARAFNDLGRVERLEEESEFLTQELTRAVGLGGRQRRVGAAAERARVNVTMAIKSTVNKIARSHPQLGHHLTCTVKTGTFCSYTPDPRVPVEWHF